MRSHREHGGSKPSCCYWNNSLDLFWNAARQLYAGLNNIVIGHGFCFIPNFVYDYVYDSIPNNYTIALTLKDRNVCVMCNFDFWNELSTPNQNRILLRSLNSTYNSYRLYIVAENRIFCHAQFRFLEWAIDTESKSNSAWITKFHMHFLPIIIALSLKIGIFMRNSAFWNELLISNQNQILLASLNFTCNS